MKNQYYLTNGSRQTSKSPSGIFKAINLYDMHSYLEKPPAISIKIIIAFKICRHTRRNRIWVSNTVYSIGVDQIMRKEGCNSQIPIFLDEPVKS